jgi:hypothetical protein
MAVTWKQLAFAADVALLSTENAHDIGTTAAPGSGTDASKHDHVHIIGTGAINSSGMFGAGVVDATALASNAVTTAKILNANVTVAKININAALDFAGFQGTNFIIEQSASPPATPVVGKIYQATGDQKFYICTSAS